MERVLAVFAKQPLPGLVKTRLAADTSDEWAAKVADAFLRDIIAKMAAVDAHRVISYTPADARNYFATLGGERFHLIEQTSGDLGCRMRNLCKHFIRKGAKAIVLMGMDSPSLPVEYVERAFDELQSADVVIGPATDGGYYLLGVEPNLPPIFDGIDWGGANVLRQTVAVLGTARLKLLPPWYDVDTVEDVWALQGHLAAMKKAGVPSDLSNTKKLLREEFPAFKQA